MSASQAQETIQWIAGIMAATVLVYMSILSLQQDYILSWPALVGMLALIILLLYGAQTLESIIKAWRMGHKRK